MLFKKGEGKGRCPFRKLKTCDDKCILYRRGVRYTEDGKNSSPFEDCAFNIMCENMEAMHNRIFMLQTEMGQTKNATMFDILVRLGEVPPEELTRQIRKMVECSSQSQIEE
jgi:hypothetical protein